MVSVQLKWDLWCTEKHLEWPFSQHSHFHLLISIPQMLCLHIHFHSIGTAKFKH